MADESLTGPASAFALARDCAADVFAIKIEQSGGLRAGLQVAAIAEAAGIELYGGTMLEGAIDPKVLAKHARKLGFPACAITDRNGLYGSMAFSEAAMGAGVDLMRAARALASRRRAVMNAVRRGNRVWLGVRFVQGWVAAAGVECAELAAAGVTGGTLYLKVDDGNETDFIRENLPSFAPVMKSVLLSGPP